MLSLEWTSVETDFTVLYVFPVKICGDGDKNIWDGSQRKICYTITRGC